MQRGASSSCATLRVGGGWDGGRGEGGLVAPSDNEALCLGPEWRCLGTQQWRPDRDALLYMIASTPTPRLFHPLRRCSAGNLVGWEGCTAYGATFSNGSTLVPVAAATLRLDLHVRVWGVGVGAGGVWGGLCKTRLLVRGPSCRLYEAAGQSLASTAPAACAPVLQLHITYNASGFETARLT
jgi:hypothetical protein